VGLVAHQSRSRTSQSRKQEAQAHPQTASTKETEMTHFTRRELASLALACAFAASLPSSAIAGRRRGDDRDRDRHRQRRSPPKAAFYKTSSGYRTPAFYAIGVLIVLDNGDECKVKAHRNGWTYCE